MLRLTRYQQTLEFEMSLLLGLDVNRLLLATFRCELSLGPATLDPIYRVIVWSLNDTRLKIMNFFLVP